MPPFNNIEITLPAKARKEMDSRKSSGPADDASVTSEISLSDFLKEESKRNDKNNDSSSSSCDAGWDPNGSDYSLNVLLHNQESKVESKDALTESKHEKMMGSDYSLNKMKLSKSNHSTSSDIFFRSCSSLRTRDSTKKEERSESKIAKVSFYPRVRIQRVTRREDLSEDQVKQVWYSRKEFQKIRRECFETIALMSDDEEIMDEEEGICSRGLEYKTEGSYKARQRNKKEVRKVVFEEQEYQSDNGLDDPEYLASLSREQSLSCVQTAFEAAARDQRDALEYLSEES